MKVPLKKLTTAQLCAKSSELCEKAESETKRAKQLVAESKELRDWLLSKPLIHPA